MPYKPSAIVATRTARGPLIAEFRFSGAVNRGNAKRNSELATAGAWTVADTGVDVGFMASNGRLSVPVVRPDAWIGLLAAARVDGRLFGSGIVMTWPGGEIHQVSGVGGAVVPVSQSERISVRTHMDRHPSEIRLFGADTALPAGVTLELCAVVL